MDDMRVTGDGTFRDVVTGTTDRGTTYRVGVAGKLEGTSVRSGTMSHDAGIRRRGTGDEGPSDWVASRQGGREG